MKTSEKEKYLSLFPFYSLSSGSALVINFFCSEASFLSSFLTSSAGGSSSGFIFHLTIFRILFRTTPFQTDSVSTVR